MKKKIIYLVIILGILLIGFITKKYLHNPVQILKTAQKGLQKPSKKKEFQNGDIIFQTSLSPQSKAVQLATNSKYSHCGLIFKKEDDNKNWYVLEAIQPVKYTLLDEWIARGKNGHFIVKRLISDPMLPKPRLTKLRTNAEKYLGKDYDLAFEWTDNKIYCSELIWKTYKETTGLEIGNLQQLRDFNLSNNLVRSKLRERYGNKIPLNETVISPQSIFDSKNLITIDEN